MPTSNAICPVSTSLINERVARFNGGFTLALLITFLVTQYVLGIAFLAVDFFIRSVGSGKSPVSLASKALVSIFNIGKKSINAGPKIFAARIGLLFTIMILLAFITGLTTVAYVLTIVIALFSFLESAFGICVACEIYPYVYRFFNKPDLKGNSGSETIPYSGFSNQ